MIVCDGCGAESPHLVAEEWRSASDAKEQLMKIAKSRGWKIEHVRHAEGMDVHEWNNHRCPHCVLVAKHELETRSRAGFTLVELLVVLFIVAVVAAVALPVVMTSWRSQRVDAAAQVIQGEAVGAIARAQKDGTAGFRLLLDPTFPVTRTADGKIDPASLMAWDRIVPLERAPGYRDGKLFAVPPGQPFDGVWDAAPSLSGPGGLTTASLYPQGRILLLIQARYRYDEYGKPRPEEPTSWYWNVRKGDKIQVNDSGPLFTVVGPMDVANPEGFVNVTPGTSYLRWPTPDGGGVDVDSYQPDFLFVVNGLDDDHDGYPDNGADGLDNNLDGNVDEWEEWAETEAWPAALASTAAVGTAYQGVPYTIFRRPVPAAGNRGIQLAGAVIDGTRSLAPDVADRVRSRLPVDPYTGNVDLMVDASGRWTPVRAVGVPTADGFNARWLHLWIANREEIASPPVATGDARLLTIDATSGAVYTTEADPADPAAARRETERGAR